MEVRSCHHAVKENLANCESEALFAGKGEKRGQGFGGRERGRDRETLGQSGEWLVPLLPWKRRRTGDKVWL